MICNALGQITDQDIRESDAGMSWPEIQARLRRGERWPAHLVDTARLILNSASHANPFWVSLGRHEPCARFDRRPETGHLQPATVSCHRTTLT